MGVIARAAFLLWCSTVAGLAADFSYVGKIEGSEIWMQPQMDEVHVFSMDGVIERGDAEVFTAAKKRAVRVEKLNPDSLRHVVLELNSPGGSLEAALELVEMVHATTTTVVGSGDTCASACALVFMAGGVGDGEDSVFRSRFLHPSGQLGFHAPYAFSREGAESFSEDIKAILMPDAEKGARVAASKMVALQRRGFLPASLVEDLLLVGDADLLMVDTIDKAGRWEIAILGQQTYPLLNGIITASNRESLGIFCANITRWLLDETAITGWGYRPLGPNLWMDGMAHSCKIETYDRDLIADVMTDGRNYRGVVWDWQTLEAEAAIASIPAAVQTGDGPFEGPVTPARVEGQCRSGRQWVGEWRGTRWQDGVAFAELRICVAPETVANAFYSLSCRHGTGRIETRVNLTLHGARKSDEITVQIGNGYELSTNFAFETDRGPLEGFYELSRDYFTFRNLKSENELILRISNRPVTHHLSGSRAAIEAMEAACK